MHRLKSAIFSKNVFYTFSAFDVFTDVSIYSAYNTVYSRASRSENHFALPTRHIGLLFDNRQSQLFFPRLIPIRILRSIAFSDRKLIFVSSTVQLRTVMRIQGSFSSIFKICTKIKNYLFCNILQYFHISERK